MIRIDALAAFTDNYIWLLQDELHKHCAVVDPGDAEPVKQWLAAHPDWQLKQILITHHHKDHTGGVLALKSQYAAQVFGPSLEKIEGIDQPLVDGQRIDVLGVAFEILHVPGHTAGHIVYHSRSEGLLFSGDTLFAAGCGRLFEGTPEQMHNSLTRLAQLAPQTWIYCTHEYTLSNLRFAQAVEPQNPLITARLAHVSALREGNQCSLPTRLEEELLTNPFLRSNIPEIAEKMRLENESNAPNSLETFTRLRRWKDNF